MFSMKFFCYHLSEREDMCTDFLSKQIWKVKVLPKMAFFAWEVARQWILTLDKLIKRVEFWLMFISCPRGTPNCATISFYGISLLTDCGL